ncbi:cyclopropane fatty acyl phospholipid synthase [Methylococcus geothermalis]|uniref:Cyclopropane fatty acyl phospholipid synthase n=1 Tax=Methylococcus geothermalis TaxID=2681310 RepID=A0A858Q996_9GAMM|nr:cyclopropane fatty acyl phospholipid synthase [Methylococcus geothermalis]QJD30276.1 cyclopropane fatty acyl phospholipid synthase [Methylococcus geothermalis]
MPINTLESLPWRGSHHDFCRERLESLLERAGVRIDGDRPWDIRVHDPAFFRRIFADASLGLGESYMDGGWDCDRPDELIFRILRAGLPNHFHSWRDIAAALQASLLNLQHTARAFHVGRRHYDIGNDLYSRMLDRRMIYSCGYWKDAVTLDQAQEAKLDLVFRKIGLEPGMRVLDIGCGWGGAAKFAAEKYGVEIHGVTVSTEQARYAREICQGLPVTIELKDYREIEGRFDRAYSLGMFEHVGCKNYSTYMKVVADHLADDGLFLLHTIGGNASDNHGNPWVERYIFPNSMLPSIAQIGEATENRLVMEDWQNFGPDYDRTLLSWYENFERHWPSLRPHYGDRFYRMWRFYLLSFAGAFRARHIQLWQIVFSPKGLAQRYDAPR